MFNYAFNFKNISESVYYFCLNNGKSYSDAIRIIEKIESLKAEENLKVENDTIKIREAIHNIKNQEDLIEYLVNNKAGFEKQNQTALSYLHELVKKSVEFAEWERQELKNENNNERISEIKSTDDISSMLSIILGFNPRKQENNKNVYKITIAKSKFPKMIRDNFPQYSQMKNLLKNERKSLKGSTELIRKTIILFTFYTMFAELKMKSKVYVLK